LPSHFKVHVALPPICAAASRRLTWRAPNATAADAAASSRSDHGFRSLQEIPRAGQTRDIAATAVFLASDASSFITGQDIAVWGGLVPYGKIG
jgi:NAD(P)-dependent dehydrogenase (short-subunit alcohol dehydrogenase family)